MNPPDPLLKLSDEMIRLALIVDGNPQLNIPPIRTVLHEMDKTVRAIQDERSREKAFWQGMSKIITFVVGNGLLSTVGLIAALLKLFGGGAS